MEFLHTVSNVSNFFRCFWEPTKTPPRFGPYRSTLELAEVICSVKGSDDRGMHPAKMTFQAIRSHLNKDMKFHLRPIWSYQGF